VAKQRPKNGDTACAEARQGLLSGGAAEEECDYIEYEPPRTRGAELDEAEPSYVKGDALSAHDGYVYL